MGRGAVRPDIRILCRPTNERPFLHDTSTSLCGSGLYAAWYACTEGEIAGETSIRGRFSPDGELWGPVETVAEGRDYHYVPASFYENGEGFHALVTRMTGHDRPADVLELIRRPSGWERVRIHRIPFLFNTAPLPLPDGALLAGGRVSPAPGELPRIPAAARLEPGSPDWTVIPMPGPWERGAYPLPVPETALLVRNSSVEAYVRNDGGNPWLFRSVDGGRTWTFAGECDIPAAGSKLYAGTLSDGREFLLYNERTPANDRSRLVLSLRAPGSGDFAARMILADGYDAASDAGPFWHYPWAAERDGILWVSCTANGPDNRRSCALIRIPLNALPV